MKKLICVLMAGAMLAISSCSKDGATGPQGPQGTNASTAYQLSFQPTTWDSTGTSGVAGAHIYNLLTSPYLSFDSVGTGAVLVYEVQTDGSQFALPFINYNSAGTQFTTQFDWQNGDIDLQVFNSLFTFTNFTGTAPSFTVVVIPGTKSLPAGVDRSNYASVEAYYHPRKVH